MSTYAGVIGKRELTVAKTDGSSIYKANLVLSVAAVFSVLTYIFLANFLVAQKYSLGVNKNRLHVLNAELASQQEYSQDGSDTQKLLFFAQGLGMVESKDIESITRDRDFALTQPH